MANVIEVERLTKVYHVGKGKTALRAVDGIDFTVRQGEIFGFLGPNGAGKTTTIRMLTGLSHATSGGARVLGYDLAGDMTRIKKQIGVVPEVSNLYDELSAFDNLIFSMQLYGVPRRERRTRADAMLQRFRLAEKRDVPFGKLSRGMKRALTVAAALGHYPPLVFMDEPTTGLDVMNARNLRQMIGGLRREGVTVFLTTHHLEEAERLCDRIAIIVNGRITATDTVDGLKAAAQESPVVEVTLSNADGQIEVRRVEGIKDVAQAAHVALAQAEAQGKRVLAINTIRPTLEDVFVKLTGLGAEVMLAEKDPRSQNNVGR
jgi:ABC-2 type transport system ATP-binding protein